MESVKAQLQANQAALTFKAFAESKVMSILSLRFRAECDVDVSLSFLMMQETQNRAVTGRDCSYSFF